MVWNGIPTRLLCDEPLLATLESARIHCWFTLDLPFGFRRRRARVAVDLVSDKCTFSGDWTGRGDSTTVLRQYSASDETIWPLSASTCAQARLRNRGTVREGACRKTPDNCLALFIRRPRGSRFRPSQIHLVILIAQN